MLDLMSIRYDVAWFHYFGASCDMDEFLIISSLPQRTNPMQARLQYQIKAILNNSCLLVSETVVVSSYG
jgi:hypothetical protein